MNRVCATLFEYILKPPCALQWVIAKVNGATREVTMCTPEICPPTVDPTDNY